MIINLGMNWENFYRDNIVAYIKSLQENPLELVTLVIDLAIVIFLVYCFFRVVKGSRAWQLIKGIVLLIVATWVSGLFNLKILNWILTGIMNLGVIAIIYEARPNVTVDAAALCLKSGNAVVLRGGKDAICSNRALYKVMEGAIAKAGFASDCVAFIDDTSRDSSKVMLGQGKYIDVCIPRGGEGLKRFVLENATMPVIASSGGNCHVYVEKTADLEMAKNIVFNAKTQRPSVCNAAEHLIVDEAICEKFLPMAYDVLTTKNVEIVGDSRAREVLPQIKAMTDEDYGTEYEAYKMSFAVVNGVKEAVDMINKYSTNHSDAIITKDEFAKNYFEKNVDSACVYVNASTRFTDGFEFGLGAEMGISTQKLHARGPIALKELTSVKYVIEGNGQIRK